MGRAYEIRVWGERCCENNGYNGGPAVCQSHTDHDVRIHPALLLSIDAVSEYDMLITWQRRGGPRATHSLLHSPFRLQQPARYRPLSRLTHRRHRPRD